MKRIFVSRGARAEKISVFLNTPFQDVFMEGIAAGVAPVDDRDFVLISHGSVEERYGIDTAVKAMALLKPHIPNLRLDIFGNGSALPQLKQLAAELDLASTVVFHGFTPMDHLVSALNSADIGLVTILQTPAMRWVHTSKMFELISMSKPVVITRSPAVEDYFDDGCLAYFDDNNPQDLARVVLQMYREPERRQQMTMRALAVYDQLKWSVESSRYCHLIENLTHRSAKLRSVA